MGTSTTTVLREDDRNDLFLIFKKRGVEEKLQLEPSYFDVMAYEVAQVDANKIAKKDRRGALRMSSLAAFTELAVTADGTRLESRLLKLSAKQQKKALHSIEAWYLAFSSSGEEDGDAVADPTVGSSGSANGRASRSKKSRRSPARKPAASKRPSKKKSGRT